MPAAAWGGFEEGGGFRPENKEKESGRIEHWEALGKNPRSTKFWDA